MSLTEYTGWIMFFEHQAREQKRQEKLQTGGQVFDFSDPAAATRMAQTFKEK